VLYEDLYEISKLLQAEDDAERARNSVPGASPVREIFVSACPAGSVRRPFDDPIEPASGLAGTEEDFPRR
jgi:hypothetical protein